MKLNKLYSNNAKFKNIQFNSGINVVFADVKTKVQEDNNSHNLGKTTLIELIDFLLLKGITKESNFFYSEKDSKGKSVFIDYVFYLEIVLNNGSYLTIRRSVKTNSKISFKLNDASVKNEFTPPQKWDFEDLGLSKSKSQLATYLDYDFFKDKSYDFRQAINYCLRKQGDYQDIYRLTKFKGGDKHWKPFMFDLLGFNGNILNDKYNLDDSIDKLKNFIKEEESNFSVKSNEKDELIGQIQIKNSEKNQIENQIEGFNFYSQDKNQIETLVDNIENKISELNTFAYNLEFEINKINSSITNEFSFDINSVKEIFNETKLYFPDVLNKEYEELIEFNKQITEERNKLLKTSLLTKNSELKEIRKELFSLNGEKEKLLGYFQETSTFKKFKNYQKILIKIESELINLNEKLKIVDIISKKEDEIKSKKDKIEELTIQLKKLLNSTSENLTYVKIRSLFSEYYNQILNEWAVISWAINTNNNVDFNAPKVESKGNDKKFTQQDKGYTYANLFCVAFDLAILSTYSSQSFYRFVYHDDVFANKDRGVKKRLLDLIQKICSEYNLQYIFTIIEDDLPLDDNSTQIKFKDEEIVLRLHDIDESGTLFGFNF